MNFEDRSLRTEIGKILVDNNLRTDQRAISQIFNLIREARFDMFKRTMYSSANQVMEMEFRIERVRDGLYDMTDQELDEWYRDAIQFMKGK